MKEDTYNIVVNVLAKYTHVNMFNASARESIATDITDRLNGVPEQQLPEGVVKRPPVVVDEEKAVESKKPQRKKPRKKNAPQGERGKKTLGDVINKNRGAKNANIEAKERTSKVS